LLFFYLFVMGNNFTIASSFFHLLTYHCNFSLISRQIFLARALSWHKKIVR